MPELPEVEIVRRELSDTVTGKVIISARVTQRHLRQNIPDDFEMIVTGTQIVSVERRGKAILLRLDDGNSILVHLGMTGQITVRPADARSQKHDHVKLILDDGREVVYNDARRFGVVSVLNEEAEETMFRFMGPEPLSEDFIPECLEIAVENRKVPVKNLLLDARIVAGVGNIYASESLWRAGIRPDRTGASLSSTEVVKLVDGIRSVLMASIRAGGSTLRDYRHADGTHGRFQELFDVYGRDGEPCHRHGCDGVIRKCTQSGRSSYFCPVCQI